jgi:5'-methylthioadenosine phosphorylase
MEPVRLGVIGGSGVYDMQTLTDIEEVMPKTPFGERAASGISTASRARPPDQPHRTQ